MIPSTVKESANKAVTKVEETAQPVVNPLVKATRSLLLASVGVVAMSKEEIEALVNRLVEKGEITEKDGRKLVEDVLNRTKELSDSTVKVTTEKVSKTTSKTEDMLTKRIEAILNTMNIPSKQDIDQLTRKIDALSRKVSALDKKLSAETVQKPAPKKKAA
jgi:poly(hydroxyalkanoate) granule-associated protein